MYKGKEIGKWIAVAESDVLGDGAVLDVDDNTVMYNKRLVFSCELKESFGDGMTLKLGHGEDCYAATWLELTSERIAVHHKYVEMNTVLDEAHGTSLSGYLTVIVDVQFGDATVTVSSAGGIYYKEKVSWAGRNGKVFVSVHGGSVENVRASWICDDYGKSIYAFGDSYFNVGTPARWPYYLHRAGYDNCLMIGYPGMGAQRAIIDFRAAITRGKPEYAVWCMGMNNGDKDGVINPVWLETTTEFINTCKNNNIIPIICTIPNTPVVNNEYKNQWVRESGCRYIDLNRAVGAHENVAWYDGMLHTDNVHPSPLGAQALYARVISDFPEITVKR